MKPIVTAAITLLISCFSFGQHDHGDEQAKARQILSSLTNVLREPGTMSRRQWVERGERVVNECVEYVAMSSTGERKSRTDTTAIYFARKRADRGQRTQYSFIRSGDETYLIYPNQKTAILMPQRDLTKFKLAAERWKSSGTEDWRPTYSIREGEIDGQRRVTICETLGKSQIEVAKKAYREAIEQLKEESSGLQRALIGVFVQRKSAESVIPGRTEYVIDPDRMRLIRRVTYALDGSMIDVKEFDAAVEITATNEELFQVPIDHNVIRPKSRSELKRVRSEIIAKDLAMHHAERGGPP